MVLLMGDGWHSVACSHGHAREEAVAAVPALDIALFLIPGTECGHL